MTKDTLTNRALPAKVEAALATLGRDISLARRRRRIPQRVLAERMMVSVQTIVRLEQGDPGISLGIFATALYVFGMTERLQNLVAPSRDTVAMGMDMGRIPKSAHEEREEEGLDDEMSGPGLNF